VIGVSGSRWFITLRLGSEFDARIAKIALTFISSSLMV
jgi:hypothetical protein